VERATGSRTHLASLEVEGGAVALTCAGAPVATAASLAVVRRDCPRLPARSGTDLARSAGWISVGEVGPHQPPPAAAQNVCRPRPLLYAARAAGLACIRAMPTASNSETFRFVHRRVHRQCEVGKMAYSYGPPRNRPNVLAWALGALVVAAGVAVAALGVRDLLDVSERTNMFNRRNSVALADAVSRVIWGVMILTIGCYIWRAARRRGWKDRSGLVLISAGYLIIAYGMSQAVHASVKIWAVSSEEGQRRVALEVGSYFLGFGFVGALFVWLGVKMANEIIITTVEGNYRG
jgi:hypothetical protein